MNNGYVIAIKLRLKELDNILYQRKNISLYN